MRYVLFWQEEGMQKKFLKNTFSRIDTNGHRACKDNSIKLLPVFVGLLKMFSLFFLRSIPVVKLNLVTEVG